MSWLTRAVLFLSFGFSSCFALSARAQTSQRPAVFISEVELITSWKNDPGVERSVVETFKELLRLHGYQTDDCEENAEAWQRIASRKSTPNDIAEYRKLDERLIAAQKCTVPPDATRAYNVKLILSYDKLLKNRRAVLHLIALGDYESLDGGYAHKPGAVADWYDLMNRAIERAISRYNENTAIRVRAPKEATVAETVRVDGRSSWDPDGDAFELRWRVSVRACIGQGKVLPRDEHDCPTGMKLGDAPVFDQVGNQDSIREFRVPLIGDYQIDVHAKIGAREEPIRSYQLRAYPRRSWSLYSGQGLLRLPTNYVSDSGRSELALVQSFGLMRRFVHRLGIFGLYEEVHFGLAINSIQQFNDFNYEGRRTSTNLTFDAVGRMLSRTGRYGLVTSSSISLSLISARRDGRDRDEIGWMNTTFIAGYYAFGNNYTSELSTFCGDICPSLALGPTLYAIRNLTAKRLGLALGGQLVAALEF
jgi:hypothetical protein